MKDRASDVRGGSDMRDGPGTAKAVRQHILNGLDAFDAILQAPAVR